MLNFKLVLSVVAKNLIIISVSLLACTGIALIYSEAFLPFVLSALITITTGLIFLFISGRNERLIIQRKEAILSVSLSWLIIGLAGSLPYLLSGTIPDFVDALFESVSGFTTTGSSILTDIESLPKSILFWRSLTHWIGGIGIIVLFIIIMPAVRIGGYNLFKSESSLQEKIKPKIKSVGSRLLFIYLLLTFAEVLLLLAGKMNLFESVCHAFGTVATGGFSPMNSSIAGYSPYIQYVVMVFMLLAGTNFVVHYYLLKRKFSKIQGNDELKLYFGIVGLLGIIISLSIYRFMDKSFEESFREAFFQVISIVTCTGYSTADYMLWPGFAWAIIFMAMFLGESTGSTAGGIKIARHVVLLKNLQRSFRQMLSPHGVMPIRVNGKSISDETNGSILSFISVYLLIFFVGTLLLAATGTDGITASSSAATCMAGIGPGIGSVGPAGNFASITVAGKMILVFLMLLGRLEIYPILLLFSSGFWKN